MKHYHFEIQGFNQKAPYPVGSNLNLKLDKGNFQMGDLAIIDVLAQTEKEAIGKAKTVLKKKYYRTGKVYECHNAEQIIDQQEIQMLQLEMQKKMLDLARGEK